MAAPDTSQGISNGIKGAWRLANLNPKGADDFDFSATGFWRSFLAVAVAAPIYALLAVLERRMTEFAMGAVHDQVRITFDSYYAHAAITYLLIWPAFAVLALFVLRLSKAERGFAAVVVTINWTRIIAMAIRLPVAALGATGALSPTFLMFALMATFGLVIYYQWFAARAALDKVGVTQAGRTATLIIAADLGMAMALSWLLSLVFGAPVSVMDSAPG